MSDSASPVNGASRQPDSQIPFLHIRDQASNVALLSVPTFAGIQDVFNQTRTHVGEILSAFEFFDQECLDLVLKHTGTQAPITQGEKPAFYALIETSGSNKDHDDEVRSL